MNIGDLLPTSRSEDVTFLGRRLSDSVMNIDMMDINGLAIILECPITHRNYNGMTETVWLVIEMMKPEGTYSRQDFKFVDSQ